MPIIRIDDFEQRIIAESTNAKKRTLAEFKAALPQLVGLITKDASGFTIDTADYSHSCSAIQSIKIPLVQDWKFILDYLLEKLASPAEKHFLSSSTQPRSASQAS